MIASYRTAAVALLVTSLAVSACGKKKVVPPPPAPPAAAPPPPTTTPAPPAPTAPPPSTPPAPTIAEETLDAANKGLKQAYFALDSYALTDAARAAIQANVEELKKRPASKVLIEGHCDSRGTAEYNLALGDRRAAAVRDYLVSLGITADRVTTVSKGKEQPFCREETESCWQQNRVAFFAFTALK